MELRVAVGVNQQREDGSRAAGAGGEPGYVLVGIALNGVGQHLHTPALDGLACAAVGFQRVLIGRIVAEVGGNHKQVALIEPRRKGFVQVSEFVEMVGGDDDGHDGWHLLQMILQERQLHFQAMFTGVGPRVVSEKFGIL